MDAYRDGLILLTLWTVLGFTQAQWPETCAGTTACQSTNIYDARFDAMLDPKSWTDEVLSTVCADKANFKAYAGCVQAARITCAGSGMAHFVMAVADVKPYVDYACELAGYTSSSRLNPCVTDKRATIETCYMTSKAALSATDAKYPCMLFDALQACYEQEAMTCEAGTQYSVKVILFKLRPVGCGSDVIKSSTLLMSAMVAVMFIFRKLEVFS